MGEYKSIGIFTAVRSSSVASRLLGSFDLGKHEMRRAEIITVISNGIAFQIDFLIHTMQLFIISYKIEFYLNMASLMEEFILLYLLIVVLDFL